MKWLRLFFFAFYLSFLWVFYQKVHFSSRESIDTPDKIIDRFLVSQVNGLFLLFSYLMSQCSDLLQIQLPISLFKRLLFGIFVFLRINLALVHQLRKLLENIFEDRAIQDLPRKNLV